jgi:hypothetical protein
VTGSLICYFPIASPPTITGPTTYAPLVSHRFGTVFTTSAGADAANSGLRKHDAWPNGNELVAKTLSGIGLAGGIGLQIPWTLTYNSQLLVMASGSSNSSAAVCVSQHDLSLAQIVGVISGDLSPTPALPGGVRMLAPGQMVALQKRGVDFLICTTLTQSNEVNLVSLSTRMCANIGHMTQTRGVLGALPDGSASVAYCLGYNSDSDKLTLPLSLYKVQADSLTKIADIAPATVDPTWTSVSFVWGLAIDQVDGNVLCMVNNGVDAVANPTYFMKLSVTTGAILWKLVLPGTANFHTNDLQQAQITKQRFYYLTTNRQICVIDTAAGTILETSAFNIADLSANHPAQVSEDVTGSVYFLGGWSEGTTHPDYYGSYMGVGGHHAVSNAPMRFFPDIGAPPSPIAGPPNPPTPGIEASSRARAWTFTLDGHKFYVLDLGTEGTLLHDATTGSWSQFITTGFWNWNFRNGTMWGQRIVGGDTISAQIWEMSPSSMKDNGTLDIVHVATGELVKRTRTYVSVADLRLSVSVGQLDDTAGGATVLLEFSDDQGQTWQAMDTKTLVQGDYSAEVAWRGLGAFAAPGRVFRITDVGGFLRIDGCDAGIDDFDEDSGNGQ